MTDTFEIRQELNFKELYSASLYVLVGWPIMRRIFLFLLIVWILSLFSAPWIRSGSAFSWMKVIGFISQPFLILSGYLVTLLFSTVFIYLTRPAIFKNNTYRFTHWGMIKTGKETVFERPWRGFLKFRETRSFFLLYISEKDAHPIQKRMFNDPAELVAFRIFLLQHLPGKP
jgi:YcxB-like protein